MGLQHVNKLEEVDQIIIVGDAKGNTAEDTLFKRNYKSLEKVWKKASEFPLTTLPEEMAKIVTSKIKIHSLYLNPLTTREFF